VKTKTSQYLPPETEIDLVLAWIRRTRESQLSHYALANSLAHYDKWLGIPVIIIAAIIGSSVFSSIDAGTIPTWAKLIIGFLSVVAGILSSLQTFFKFSERSEKHQLAATRYGSIRRKLEAVYAQNDTQIDENYLNELRESLDNLARESPHVPVGVFKKIQENDFLSAPVSASNPTAI
jgi:hypothetical protein